jgi:hypothetical protein
MKSGDCQGALDAFDAALQHVVDYTIIRDRGLCHEKLGYNYPAIDDFRLYLTQMPDAPDADDIRQRLARLEGNGDGDDTPDSPPAKTDAKSGTADASDPPVEGGTPHDQLDFVSRDESVNNSPLRAGKGVMLYPFFSEHKLVPICTSSNCPSASFGDPQTWSEAVGVGFRDSFDASGTLVIEAGYQLFNGTDVSLVSESGFTSLVAYELRFPTNPAYDNQWLLAFGLGYEHVFLQSSDPAIPSTTQGAIVPRVRGGFRHMLGHAMAVDVSLDVGATKFFEYSAKSLFPAGEPVSVLLAANVGVVWGL